MKKLILQFSIVGLSFAALFALTGCGNALGGRYQQRAPKDSYQTRSTASGYTSTIPNTSGIPEGCSTRDNVAPDNGGDTLTACPLSDSIYKLKIHGQSSSPSNQICVYPAQVYDANHIYVKREVNGVPIIHCVQASDDGALVEFQYTIFNAVFVVHQEDKDAMTSCLTLGQYYNCPSYSFGQFR